MRLSNRVRIIALSVAIGVLAAAAIALLLPQRMLNDRVEQAVRAYDEALIDGLARLDPEAIDDVATAEQKAKVAAYVTYLWGSGVYMEAQLVALEVLEASAEGDTITALVHEEWRYLERDRTTSESVGGSTRVEITARYTLVTSSGRTRVAEIEVLEER